jgi:anti-sigma regulatory factor (Ser/Thr protein kinase)
MRHGGSTRAAVLELVEQGGSISGPEIADRLGITRQAVNLHLRDLLSEGKIVKTGSTRAARYHPRSAAPEAQVIERELLLAGLDEATVYERLAVQLNLSHLPDNVKDIVHYAFTEMLNNAIDHSLAERCRIRFELDAGSVSFEVRDSGIGAFHSIAEKFSLEDETAAMVELVKGKTTTKPDRHAGEGLFFVARAADRFELRSHRLEVQWDRQRDDVFVSDCRYLEGTRVRFECSRHSRTRLESLFEAFAPASYDYRFEKTRVAIKLLQDDYVSRSEAKRLLHNLDRFSIIELDFRDVTHVGQGFADEVFRVFTSQHPGISIEPVNAGKSVAAMISHVRTGRA